MDSEPFLDNLDNGTLLLNTVFRLALEMYITSCWSRSSGACIDVPACYKHGNVDLSEGKLLTCAADNDQTSCIILAF